VIISGQIGIQTFSPALTAVTAGLDAAERRFRQGQTKVVDRNNSCLQTINLTQRPMHRLLSFWEGESFRVI
jgi:hypothetical protein